MSFIHGLRDNMVGALNAGAEEAEKAQAQAEAEKAEAQPETGRKSLRELTLGKLDEAWGEGEGEGEKALGYDRKVEAGTPSHIEPEAKLLVDGWIRGVDQPERPEPTEVQKQKKAARDRVMRERLAMAGRGPQSSPEDIERRRFRMTHSGTPESWENHGKKR